MKCRWDERKHPDGLHPPSTWYSLETKIQVFELMHGGSGGGGVKGRQMWHEVRREDGSTCTYVRQRVWAVGGRSDGMLRHREEHRTDPRDEVSSPKTHISLKVQVQWVMGRRRWRHHVWRENRWLLVQHFSWPLQNTQKKKIWVSLTHFFFLEPGTSAGSFGFQLWNLAHASFHPPTENVFCFDFLWSS